MRTQEKLMCLNKETDSVVYLFKMLHNNYPWWIRVGIDCETRRAEHFSSVLCTYFLHVWKRLDESFYSLTSGGNVVIFKNIWFKICLVECGTGTVSQSAYTLFIFPRSFKEVRDSLIFFHSSFKYFLLCSQLLTEGTLSFCTEILFLS